MHEGRETAQTCIPSFTHGPHLQVCRPEFQPGNMDMPKLPWLYQLQLPVEQRYVELISPVRHSIGDK